MSTRIIKINRGDSFEFTTEIPDKNDPTKNYMLSAENDDAFYFAICLPHQLFENAIILKGCTATSTDDITGEYDQNRETGKITVKLTPAETMQLMPGIYYYTTKLYSGGTPGLVGSYCDAPTAVRTIIERTKFIVNE